jgi:DHA1 family inner membrane transport protein
MAFFHNRTVNLLNLHTAVSMIALTGGGAFYSAYLLTAGLSVPLVLLVNAGIVTLRFALRSVLLTIAIPLGLRRLVIFGAILMAVQFPLIAEVQGTGTALLILIFASAFGDTIYWPSYHAYFASLGDEDHRGQQLGIREALSALVAVVSPLAAGWLLVAFGPHVAFDVTAAVQALSAIPLLWTPNIAVRPSAPGAFRAALPGVALFVGDGCVAASYVVIWQIGLFLTLGKSYTAYGGALAMSALVGAIGGMLLGRLIDSGKGTRALFLAIATLAFVTVLRAAVLSYPVLAVIANALGALVGCLYVPTMMTAVYNMAKRSPCALRFHILAEGGWDVGFAIGCGLGAGMVALGLSLRYAILLALIGVAGVFRLLYRYYGVHADELIDASQTQPEELAKI